MRSNRRVGFEASGGWARGRRCCRQPGKNVAAHRSIAYSKHDYAMVEICLKPTARADLRRLKPFHRRQFVDAIERQLRHEPERVSKAKIKRLRGKQMTTLCLRIGEPRVFYDVEENIAAISRVLHKSETGGFYVEGELS